MFRRPIHRSLRRALRPEVHPLLQRANDLLASGNYPAAADAFEQLARGAQARGLPRDAQLFLQAGRCRVMANQVPQGMADLKQGLAIIAGRGNWQHLSDAGQRVANELLQRGLAVEADEIQAVLRNTLPATFTAIPRNEPAARKPLPTACSSCGGPLRSDEVEWIDDVSAECPFCGGVVRAGS